MDEAVDFASFGVVSTSLDFPLECHVRFNQRSQWHQLDKGAITEITGENALIHPGRIKFGYSCFRPTGPKTNRAHYALAGPGDKAILPGDLPKVAFADPWTETFVIEGVFLDDDPEYEPREEIRFVFAMNTASYMPCCRTLVDEIRREMEKSGRMRFPVVKLDTKEDPNRPVLDPVFRVIGWREEFNINETAPKEGLNNE